MSHPARRPACRDGANIPARFAARVRTRQRRPVRSPRLPRLGISHGKSPSCDRRKTVANDAIGACHLKKSRQLRTRLVVRLLACSPQRAGMHREAPAANERPSTNFTRPPCIWFLAQPISAEKTNLGASSHGQQAHSSLRFSLFWKNLRVGTTSGNLPLNKHPLIKGPDGGDPVTEVRRVSASCSSVYSSCPLLSQGHACFVYD